MPERIENRMVIDSEWERTDPVDVEQKSNASGYSEIGTGIFIPEEAAYEYALERISLDEELKQELVDWFYSGNWVKEDLDA